ncbi:uncharacterized protein VTP21DRAFT_2540 [Calcarisporiella thermophila]|uniref:uncharacterized protein n=1 Tax=Calcarisporiella thermophila TaxID=911321 RepID=UPI0037428ABD
MATQSISFINRKNSTLTLAHPFSTAAPLLSTDSAPMPPAAQPTPHPQTLATFPFVFALRYIALFYTYVFGLFQSGSKSVRDAHVIDLEDTEDESSGKTSACATDPAEEIVMTSTGITMKPTARRRFGNPKGAKVRLAPAGSGATESAAFAVKSPAASTETAASATGAPSASFPSSGTSHTSPPTAYWRQKTLVLDLDETLIHSTSRGSFKADAHHVEVLVDNHACLYYVYKRPHVDYFLRKVSEWYRVVVYTASMAEYADPVIDWLDPRGSIISARYFRKSCIQGDDGSYFKDLTIIEPDLSKVCLVDNSPASFCLNQENGIPIESWINDPNDEALLDLLPFLDALRFTEDVRSVLSLRLLGVEQSKPG